MDGDNRHGMSCFSKHLRKSTSSHPDLLLYLFNPQTKDSVPYIGAVPSFPGQWIAAGFGGHGMARIFTCVPGLVKLIQGGEWDESLPSCFKVTAERLVGEAGSVAVKGQAPL